MMSTITQRRVVPHVSKPWIGSYQSQYSQKRRQIVERPPSQVMLGIPAVDPFQGDACHSSRRRYGNSMAAIEQSTNESTQQKIPFRVLKICFSYKDTETTE